MSHKKGALANFLNSHSDLIYAGETYFFDRHYEEGYQFYKQFLEDNAKNCTNQL